MRHRGHISKMLRDYVDQHIGAIIKGEAAGPAVAMAPLPAGAQHDRKRI
jgi:hypothetical protein